MSTEPKNNVAAIIAIEQQLSAMKRDYDNKSAALTKALNILREENEVCENCNGAKGSTYRIVAEADPEWHRCSACNGSGRAKKKAVKR